MTKAKRLYRVTFSGLGPKITYRSNRNINVVAAHVVQAAEKATYHAEQVLGFSDVTVWSVGHLGQIEVE